MDDQRIILVNGAQGTVHRHCLYFPWAMDKKKVIDRRAVAVKEKEGKKRPKTRPCYSNSKSNTILRMRNPFIEKVIP